MGEETPYLMNQPYMKYDSDIDTLLLFDCFGGNTIQIDRFYLSSIYFNHFEIKFLVFDYVIAYQDQLFTGTYTIAYNR